MEKLTGIPKEQMIGKGKFEYALPLYGERRPVLIDLALAQDKPITQTKGIMILFARNRIC